MFFQFGFVLVFLIFFGLGFLFLHKKMEEILSVLMDIRSGLSRD